MNPVIQQIINGLEIWVPEYFPQLCKDLAITIGALTSFYCFLKGIAESWLKVEKNAKSFSEQLEKDTEEQHLPWDKQTKTGRTNKYGDIRKGFSIKKMKTHRLRLYQQDTTHKEMEVFDDKGVHLGATSLLGGKITKNADPTRNIAKDL